MPVFAYAARDKVGKIVRGHREADNDELVTRQLQESGYEVTQVISEDAPDAKAWRDEVPIITIVNSILMYAVKDGASEIQIEPQPEEVRICYRINGELQELMKVALSEYELLISRIKTMADLNIAERRIPQDGRIYIQMHDKSYDLRVSTCPVQYGEKVAIHVLHGAAQ